MSRVPRIRFKGFEEDWEQRKLSEIYKNICNAYVGIATPYYVEDGHFYLEANNVKDGKINYNSKIFINDNFYESQKDKWLNSGDIVMVQSGHVGHAAVIPEELENTVAHALILFKNAKVKIEPYFLNYQYQTLNFKRKIENITVGNTIKHILASDMKEYMVYVSRFAEQIIVSKYFQTLDHLITLHQRKLEKLKIIKKSMLENLFPQNGEKTPKIRFSGFTKDWEQRKLGEIAERIIRKNEKLESTLPLTISAQYGLIDQNEFFDKRIASKDVRGYYLIKKGEFAYNKSTSVDAPLGAIKRLDKYKNGVLSTLYILFKIIDDTSTSSDYLVTYYATDLWHRGIQSIAAEGARNHGLLNIVPNDFFETILSIPLNVSEQKKVGDFFISLDHLITLHQSKLEKLQKVKKSMLESMFV